jgi:hypothetical protein
VDASGVFYPFDLDVSEACEGRPPHFSVSPTNFTSFWPYKHPDTLHFGKSVKIDRTGRVIYSD